jgi:hypothetical protein
MQREELDRYLNGLLEVSRFRDYCPNELRVEKNTARGLWVSTWRRASAWSSASSTFPIRYESASGPGRGRVVLFIYFSLLAQKTLIRRRLSGIIASFCMQQILVFRGTTNERR